jgi:acetyl esterase/lipase
MVRHLAHEVEESSQLAVLLLRRASDDVRVSTPPARFLDAELAAISVMIPDLDFDDVERGRTMERELLNQGRVPLPSVEIVDREVVRRDGGRVGIRIYRPVKPRARSLPAMLYLHGGAFMFGSVATEDDRCEFYARDAGCVVVAVDYRLAPEDPFPAGFYDCLDVLSWIYEEAVDWGIDPRRVSIGGNSAGGTLAAAVALEVRSEPRPPLIHQLLVNPVLDCRSRSASMQAFTDTPGWARDRNILMWERYLGGDVEPDYRASPALCDDLRGLPRTSMWIAEYDPRCAS